MDELFPTPSDLRRDDRPTSWASELAGAALTGVTTALMPVQRWSPPARWTLHGGMGALAAGATAWGIRHQDQLRDQLRDQPRDADVAPDEQAATSTRAPGAVKTAAVALAAGALTVGASRGGQELDAWIERRLTARGVRRPRLWIGVGAAGLSLAAGVADRRTEAASRNGSGPEGRDT